ncbi:MAG TPA: hypothetical protein VGF95_04100 [Solirubrobacteraceae bacterium]|jgi:cytochrome c-type biogenesis protein CcmH/NrfF
MTGREQQLHQVCAWNRTLAAEVARLGEQLRCAAAENGKLADVNARLGVEAEASEALLAAAMVEARRARRL